MLVKVATTSNGYFYKTGSVLPYGKQIWIPLERLLTNLDSCYKYYEKYECGTNRLEEYQFPYSLSLMEYRIQRESNMASFKFPIWCDLDIIDTRDGGQNIDKLANCKNYLANILEERQLACWFTGKKGFRVMDPTGIPQRMIYLFPGTNQRQHRDENILPRLRGLLKDELNADSTISTLIENSIDIGVWAEGKGVKFDLFTHHETHKFPLVIGECDSSSDGYMCSRCSMMFISRYWRNLYHTCEGILKSLDLSLYPEVPDGSIFQTNIATPSITHVTRTLPDNRRKSRIAEIWNKQPANVRSYFLNLYPSFITEDNTLGISFGFSYQGRVCDVHEKIHKHPKSYYIYSSRKPNFIACYCFSSAPSSSRYNGYLLNLSNQHLDDVYSTYTLDDLLNDKNLSTERSSVLRNSGAIHLVSVDYIDNILMEDQHFHKTINIIKAPMGSGKSTAVRNYIKKVNPKRVLAISTRITSAGFLAESFGCASYKNLNHEIQYGANDISKMDRLVISMESLHKIIVKTPNTQPMAQKYDVIILDEIESILQGFSSSTMDGQRRNYRLLKDLLKRANKVFVMDALLSQHTLNYLFDTQLIREGMNNYSLLFNTKNRDPTIYLLYTNETFHIWIDLILDSLVNNRKIVLVADSKKFMLAIIDEVLSKFQEKRGQTFDAAGKLLLIITGSSSKADKYTSVDMNFWYLVDFLAFTPAITVGNSYNPEDPENIKDELFGAFKGTSLAGTALQMCGRFRQTKSNRKHVLLGRITKNAPRLSSQILGKRKQCLETINERTKYIQMEAKYLQDEGVLIVDGPLQGVVSVPLPISEYNNIMITNEHTKLASFDNIYVEFVKTLKMANIQYEKVTTTTEGEKVGNAIYRQIQKSSEKIEFNIKNDTVQNSMLDHGVEKMVALGMPQENTEAVRSSLSSVQCAEFLTRHFIEPRTQWNAYMLHKYSDCTEILFQEEYDKIQREPTESQGILYRILNHARPLIQYYKTQNFVDFNNLPCPIENALIQYFSDIDTIKHQQFYFNIFNLGGEIPRTPLQMFTSFVDVHLKFFGVAMERSSFDKLKRENRLPSNPILRQKISIQDLKSKKRVIHQSYFGSQNPKSSKRRNPIYEHIKDKTRNTLILGCFKFGKEALPDDYQFKHLFEKISGLEIDLRLSTDGSTV